MIIKIFMRIVKKKRNFIKLFIPRNKCFHKHIYKCLNMQHSYIMQKKLKRRDDKKYHSYFTENTSNYTLCLETK